MRIGEKTHHLLSDYLRALKKWPVDTTALQAAKDRVLEEMRTEFEVSKTRDYTVYDRDRKFWLSEHFYFDPAAGDGARNLDDQFEEAMKRVLNNLDVFMQSDRLEKVQHYFDTAKTVFIENPREKDFDGMKVNLYSIPALKDVNVMASPDFGVVFSDNKYLIIDRKTGQEKLDTDWVSDQLKIYALKLILKAKIDIDTVDIEWYEIYLPSLHKRGGKIEKSDIDGIIEKLKEDVEFQKQFLVDGDIFRNNPLPHSNFPRTNNLKKCVTCTFREVCGELKAFE